MLTSEEPRTDAWIGLTIGGLLWLVGTIGLFVAENGEAAVTAFAATMGVAFVVALVRDLARRRRLSALVREYVARFGAAPPGYSLRGTGLGWAAGSLSGHPVAGGLLGAAADLWKMARNERGMSAEQRALHGKITALQSWSSFHGLYLLGVFLTLSACAAWVVRLLRAG